MRKFAGICGVFLVSFAVGYFYLTYTTEVKEVDRIPAAIRSTYDFSNLTGEKLEEAVKQRLIVGFEIKKSPEGTGFGLGHFVYQNNKGEKVWACQKFGRVVLTFIAEGSSVAGDKPSMELEGVCETSKDLTKINPLFLPITKILSEKPGDGEFQFNEGHPVKVRFANLPESWPHTWLLESVKLYSDLTTESFIVESNDVAKYLGHPLVLSF
ncbi:MAG TPA: hypothetical protein VN132_03425 [Bdellovibrio sp.]|nr:hypothetical protein [Bdellovibrio sp.]